MAELRQHLPRDCLPQHLGGLLPLDAYSWNQQLLAGQNGRVDPVDELVGIPLEDGSIHIPGPESMRPQELLTHLGRLQRSGVHQEYEEVRKEPPPGTFHCAQWVYSSRHLLDFRADIWSFEISLQITNTGLKTRNYYFFFFKSKKFCFFPQGTITHKMQL